jgi:hypothetical protein
VITVLRGSEKLAEKSVEAVETKTAVVTLDLAAIERAAPPPPPPPGVATVPSWQRTVGWVVFGVGAVTLAAGGTLGGVALSHKLKADSPDMCANNFCTPAGIDEIQRARTFANAAQWVGVAGLVVTAVGVTVVLTSPSARPAPPKASASLSLAPWAGPQGGGLTLRGSLQ